MSRRMAWSLVVLLVMLLLVGTQMPGVWRDGIEHRLHVPFPLSSMAHLLLFMLIALSLLVRPLAWPFSRVLLVALSIALVTEGLQFFAADRHPRLMDIGIDLTGTLLALILSKSRYCSAPTR